MATSKKSVDAPKAAPVVTPPAKAAPAAKKVSATKKPAPAKAVAKPAPGPVLAAPIAAVATKAPAKKAPAAKKATKAVAKPAARVITPEQRANYIEVAAFYIAERRGFTPGNPEEDWLLAAAEIDRLIDGGHFGK